MISSTIQYYCQQKSPSEDFPLATRISPRRLNAKGWNMDNMREHGTFEFKAANSGILITWFNVERYSVLCSRDMTVLSSVVTHGNHRGAKKL